jgi:hypothetical protein
MAIAKKQDGKDFFPLIDKPTPDLWQPQWLVDLDNEMAMGIAWDDGCYVVLNQMPSGNWRPSTHIPVEAAKMIGRLAGS